MKNYHKSHGKPWKTVNKNPALYSISPNNAPDLEDLWDKIYSDLTQLIHV